MNYKVELTNQAQLDLFQIVEYFSVKIGLSFGKKKLKWILFLLQQYLMDDKM